MKETVIRVDHLDKSYGETRAVQDLSFEVASRKCHAFLGPNGAGKTTAMKVLYGKAKPDANPDTVINVLGYDPRSHELQIKTLSGVVPQEDNLDVELNVQQNLQIFSKFYNLSRARAQSRRKKPFRFCCTSQMTPGAARQ